MSREIRRVPLDFRWPLEKTWGGYLRPEAFNEDSCPDCELGYSPEAQLFHDQWYGKKDFDPASTGSTPFLPEGEEAQAWGQRQSAQDPSYSGADDFAVQREAGRIVRFWNGAWSHHLSQADVDALVADERLWNFTRDFVSGEGWVERPGATAPTAAEVNRWSLFGFGHDGINAGICIRARAEREGVELLCSTCGGSASIEAYEGQRAEAEAWKPTEVPRGEGWQLWETVSEGSPLTPVFATPEELARAVGLNYRHYFGCFSEPRSYESLVEWIKEDGWEPSLMLRGVN